MRYFLQLSYDGTAYHGWQVQPNADTVQARLNAALSTLLRHEVSTTGAGRTDTGVHARMMVAHFDTERAFDCKDLCFRLSRLLPPDIAVQQIVPVSENAHARFDAIRRAYHYDIICEKSPFHRFFTTHIHYQLDFNRMNEAALLLHGKHDFTSFSKTGSDTKTNFCTINEAQWLQLGENYWRFRISADRFLRGMVRAIVGTLFNVGNGKLSPEELNTILQQTNRSAAGESAPAKGLSLVEVSYPDNIFKPCPVFYQ